MASSDKCGNWVETFPGNLRWSNATQIVKGMVPWAATAMAEIDLVTQRLKAREKESDPDRAWKEEWARMGDQVAKVADAAAAANHQITAGNNYMRAGNYYYSAERFIEPGEDKMVMYRKALRCYRAALERLHPNVEIVDVPYEQGPLARDQAEWNPVSRPDHALNDKVRARTADKFTQSAQARLLSAKPVPTFADRALAAYFMKAPGVTGRAPTVVLFDGMDNCKEMSVIFAGLEFAKHGIHTLAIDGPGQGETLRLRKIHSRPDYEVAGAAAYDYVASRGDVDPKKVAVMGYSFGGYHAPRVAGFEKRYAACVAFGAMHWSLHGWQSEIKARLAADSKTSFTSNFQFRWVVGAPDNATALEMAKRFTLEGVAQRIECPFLVVHGENDRIVPVEEAHTLYAKVGSKRKDIRIFTADEGGAEHCQVDHRQYGVEYIADWLLANMK